MSGGCDILGSRSIITYEQLISRPIGMTLRFGGLGCHRSWTRSG
jgi:hypothetical protein